MNIAVVGAGWAGLAAAHALRQAGHAVTVFEAAHVPGGRARRVDHTGFSEPLDNGQHLLLGAYRDTLALISELSDPALTLQRLPLEIASADGAVHLRAPRLPAPWHLALALLRARGLRFADKRAALGLMRQLARQQWRCPAQQSVTQLLRSARQPAALAQAFWIPLCLAALNTLPDEASAQLFATVLRDSLTRKRADSDLLLPRTDLSALWPQAAATHCVMRYGHTVRQVTPGQGGIHIDGESYAAAVLATPPATAARLLAPAVMAHGAPASWLAPLRAFEFEPIATLYLRLAAAWPLPRPMLMLREAAHLGHVGQWLFDRSQLGAGPGELAIVVSAARTLLDGDRDQAIEALIEQVRSQIAAHPAAVPAMPAVQAQALIVEKRATFRALPGLHRPDGGTPWPRLRLAGDWTDTGYPGVLEGAVRSGRQAAEHLMRALSPSAAS